MQLKKPFIKQTTKQATQLTMPSPGSRRIIKIQISIKN